MTNGAPGPRDQAGGGKPSREQRKAAKAKAKKAKRQAWRDMSAGHERAGDGSDQR